MYAGETDRFDRAVLLLPMELRAPFRELVRTDRQRAEELRLRVGQAPTVLLPDGERTLRMRRVTAEDLENTIAVVTRASLHASASCEKLGYIPAPGGYRVGLCGTAVVTDGRAELLRDFSSLCIRIPREVRGAARSVLPALMKSGRFLSTLIVSPPGAGKTTLLRDMVRILSDGDGELGVRPFRVALADERGEIAAVYRGAPQNDVGAHTDVMDLCPKAEAVFMLLRSMNPEIVAADEITAPGDAAAMAAAARCGAALLATAHGERPEDLRKKPAFAALLEEGVFARAVTITVQNGERLYGVEDLERGAGGHA